MRISQLGVSTIGLIKQMLHSLELLTVSLSTIFHIKRKRSCTLSVIKWSTVISSKKWKSFWTFQKPEREKADRYDAEGYDVT